MTGLTFKAGIENIIVPKIRQVCPQHLFKIKKGSKYSERIEWASGSETWFMSAEQKDIEFEGNTIDWVWQDEPVRRSIFMALKRGLMKSQGPYMITATLLDEPWIYEDLYLPGFHKKDPDIEIFEGSSYENKKYLTKAGIESLAKYTTEGEYETRIMGKPSNLGGRVYTYYSEERHKIDTFSIPHHWPVWISIDPHGEKPHAVIFVAVSPSGIMYVCNEIYMRCTIAELASEIKRVAAQYRVANIMIDTSAQDKDWNKVSARKILSDNHVYTKLAQKKNQKKSGILKINQLFKEDKIFIMNNCKRTLREIMNYIYKKDKKDKMPTNEPIKKYDEMMDNLRYIVVEDPKFHGMAKIKEHSYYATKTDYDDDDDFDYYQ